MKASFWLRRILSGGGARLTSALRGEMLDRMSLPPGHIARRVRIRGRVQGVSYRWWTVRTARELGLDGWVRNRLDGSVEALAAGPAEAVETLIERCREGPSAARIDGVEVEDALGIVPAGFTQKPTV